MKTIYFKNKKEKTITKKTANELINKIQKGITGFFVSFDDDGFVELVVNIEEIILIS